MTRLRRVASLVLLLEGGVVVAHDFLRNVRASLDARTLALLAGLAEWRDPSELFAGHSADRPGIARDLLRLMDDGLIVALGSRGAALDERYRAGWRWGAVAGLYHFAIKDTEYLGPSSVASYLTAKVASEPTVPLFTAHAPEGSSVKLPPPDLEAAGGLLGLMARRRSWRGYDGDRPLPLAVLRDLLFSGFAITGFARSAIPGEGEMPLTTTPSGGARNPYEAYVVARAVEGLPPGVYHYSGLTGSLAQVAAGVPPLSSLLGGQQWFEAAAAAVLLVATFERTSWKYGHPTGLRALFLEAGHIAQNLLLAATSHGLAATPTAALSDRAIETLLGLDRVRQGAIHAVVVGVRSAAPSGFDFTEVRANPHLLDQLQGP